MPSYTCDEYTTSFIDCIIIKFSYCKCKLILIHFFSLLKWLYQLCYENWWIIIYELEFLKPLMFQENRHFWSRTSFSTLQKENDKKNVARNTTLGLNWTINWILWLGILMSFIFVSWIFTYFYRPCFVSQDPYKQDLLSKFCWLIVWKPNRSYCLSCF